jgi:DNA-binding protein HU-beta
VNKNELVAKMAELTGHTKADANRALDAYMQAVMETVASGDSVRLVGFMTFETANKPAHEGRHPKTGAVIKIPASIKIKVKVGKVFKDLVNKKKKKK